eukprot:1139034-Pelagomonas_calceolata.AAC.4
MYPTLCTTRTGTTTTINNAAAAAAAAFWLAKLEVALCKVQPQRMYASPEVLLPKHKGEGAMLQQGIGSAPTHNSSTLQLGCLVLMWHRLPRGSDLKACARSECCHKDKPFPLLDFPINRCQSKPILSVQTLHVTKALLSCCTTAGANPRDCTCTRECSLYSLCTK